MDDASDVSKVSVSEKILLALVAFVVLIKASKAFEIHHHGDALYYTLVAPKLWKLMGWEEMWEHLHSYAQAGYFDLIYFVPFVFSDSLLQNQIVCQVLHYAFTFGIGTYLIHKTIPHRLWAALAILCLFTIGQDSSHFLYAKNDGAVAVMGLLAAIYVYRAELNYRTAIVAGLLIGLAPGFKLSGLCFSVVLGAYYAWNVWKTKKPLGLVAVAGGMALLAMLPQLAKNYYYTGNPLFPGFVEMFPGNMSEEMVLYYGRLGGDELTVAIVLNNLWDLLTGKMLFLICPVVFFFNLRKGVSRPNVFLYLTLGTFVLYLLGSGEVSHPRYFFVCYFMLIMFLFLSLQEYNLSGRRVQQTAWALAVVALVDAKVDLGIRSLGENYQRLFVDSEKEAVAAMIPWAHVWKPLQETKHPLILSNNFHYNYYSPPGTRIHITTQSPQASFFVNCGKPGDIEKLREYDYVFIGPGTDNPCIRHVRASMQKLDLDFDGNEYYRVAQRIPAGAVTKGR